MRGSLSVGCIAKRPAFTSPCTSHRSPRAFSTSSCPRCSRRPRRTTAATRCRSARTLRPRRPRSAPRASSTHPPASSSSSSAHHGTKWTSTSPACAPRPCRAASASPGSSGRRWSTPRLRRTLFRCSWRSSATTTTRCRCRRCLCARTTTLARSSRRRRRSRPSTLTPTASPSPCRTACCRPSRARCAAPCVGQYMRTRHGATAEFNQTNTASVCHSP